MDFDSIRVGIRLHLISTLAILLPTPVGQGLLKRIVGIWLASTGRFVFNLSCIEKEVSDANIWVFDY